MPIFLMGLIMVWWMLSAGFKALKRPRTAATRPQEAVEQNAAQFKQPSYHYRGKQHIMTRREENFFETLNEIFGDKCHIVPQVHLSALLEHRVKGQNWQGAFSHINGKSVDFVLLRRRDLSVLCAVELDDRTHATDDRIQRDNEVERIFENAHIPLVRLSSPENMPKQELVDLFAKIINKTQEPNS